MKLLDLVFETNADKMGTMRFVQVEKVETPSLNCYIYRRDQLDGTFFSYEVFIAKRRYKGDKLPGGLVELEDRERYCTANSFGSTAKECRSLPRSQVILAEFVKKLHDKENKKNEPADVVDGDDFVNALHAKLEVTPKVKGQRGRKRIERPDIQYPTMQRFGMKDILKMNEKYSQPLAYQQLKKDITAGLLVEVGRVKSANGRGKPSVVYSVRK